MAESESEFVSPRPMMPVPVAPLGREPKGNKTEPIVIDLVELDEDHNNGDPKLHGDVDTTADVADIDIKMILSRIQRLEAQLAQVQPKLQLLETVNVNYVKLIDERLSRMNTTFSKQLAELTRRIDRLETEIRSSHRGGLPLPPVICNTQPTTSTTSSRTLHRNPPQSQSTLPVSPQPQMESDQFQLTETTENLHITPPTIPGLAHIHVSDPITHAHPDSASGYSGTRTTKSDKSKVKSASLDCICPKCGENFTQSSFLRHIRVVHNTSMLFRFLCKFCLASYSDHDKLSHHQMEVHRHTSEEPEVDNNVTFCPEGCGLAFTFAGDMLLHMKKGCQVPQRTTETDNARTTEENTPKLPVLSTSATSAAELDTKVCPKCGETFSRGDNMLQHLRRVHSRLPKVNFRCEFCASSYSQRAKLRYHQKKMHGRISKELEGSDVIPTPCPEDCGRTFTRALKLLEHLKDCRSQMNVESAKSTPEKPSNIDSDTDSEFEDSDNQDETNERNDVNLDHPNVNLDKSQVFPTTEAGIRRSSSDFNDRTHFCNVCGVGYRKKYLQRHLRTHTGERLFSCQYCDKSFGERTTLKTHTRIHTGERPYNCKYCGKTFNHRSAIRLHTFVHTGKPYACGECGYRSVAPHDLRRHQRGHAEGTVRRRDRDLVQEHSGTSAFGVGPTSTNYYNDTGPESPKLPEPPGPEVFGNLSLVYGVDHQQQSELELLEDDCAALSNSESDHLPRTNKAFPTSQDQSYRNFRNPTPTVILHYYPSTLTGRGQNVHGGGPIQ